MADDAVITTPHFTMKLPGANNGQGSVCIMHLPPKHGFAANVNVLVDILPKGGICDSKKNNLFFQFFS
jgi:hypothetical protein